MLFALSEVDAVASVRSGIKAERDPAVALRLLLLLRSGAHGSSKWPSFQFPVVPTEITGARVNVLTVKTLI